MRMVARSLAALLVAGCSVVAGCSTETGDPAERGSAKKVPIKLDENAERAPQGVADVTIVADDQISFPQSAATSAWVRNLKKGTVIAGNRDSSSRDLNESKNPYGFLRKVVSIEEGNPIVIKTERAYLPDLLEGDLIFGGEGQQKSIFTDASDITTRSLRPLAESGTSSGSGQASILGELKADVGPVVKLSNGTFGLDAQFDAELQIRHWWRIPTGIERAMAKLTLNPRASVDIEVGAKIEAQNPSGGGTLSKTWTGPSVAIPLGGPIPVTLRLRPEVTCSITAGGEITARGRAHLTGRTAAGFNYQNNDIQPIYEPPTLTPGFDFTGVQGKAFLNGECAIQAVVSLLAFDAAGIEGKVGPYASINAELCASYSEAGANGGFTIFEEHGVKVDAEGRLQVPGLGEPSINKPIFGFKPAKSEPRYFIGDDSTCRVIQRDSCEGKPNGLYCSEINENSSYQCNGGTISGGQQCPGTQKCKGPLTNAIRCE